jgi:hypothetical protein
LGVIEGEIDPDTGKPMDPQLAAAKQQVADARKGLDKETNKTVKKMVDNRF